MPNWYYDIISFGHKKHGLSRGYDYSSLWEGVLHYYDEVALRSTLMSDEEWDPDLVAGCSSLTDSGSLRISAEILFNLGFWGEAYEWFLAQSGYDLRLEIDEWGCDER